MGKNFLHRGRIVGILDDGFVMQDEMRRVDILWDEKVNVGDIVRVRGREEEVMVDGKKGLVLVAEEVSVLVKCDDDFFIKKDDPNYRKMVLERIFLERMSRRAEIIDGVREFFKGRGFLEVETPSLVRLPGMEPYLDVFESEFVGAAGGEVEREEMFLITSPEYAMKKLLVGGAEKIFQICKSFRNKETDSNLHNPEFTLLEWYRAFSDYEVIMRDTEELVCALAEAVNGEPVVRFDGREVDVSTPWRRLRVRDAFKEYAGIEAEDFETSGDLRTSGVNERFRAAVRKKGYEVSDDTSYDDLFFTVFMNEIEPKLGVDKAVILYDYPVSMAALSRQCKDDPKYAERFEAYVAGVELCNAFSELNDWKEQQKRLKLEREERLKMGKTEYAVDESFIDALKFGMPLAGGNALGIDRLVMLLLDVPDIRDVMFFPHRDL